MPFLLYVLCEPQTRCPRYVGISQQPAKRFANHLYNAHRPQGNSRLRHTRKERWIRELGEQHRVPFLRILCILEDKQEAERLEQLLAARWPNLTNEWMRTNQCVMPRRYPFGIGRPVSLETRRKLAICNIKCKACLERLKHGKPLLHHHGKLLAREATDIATSACHVR